MTCAFDQHKRQIYLSINKIDDIQVETLLIEIVTFCISNPNSKLNQPSVKNRVEKAILELERAIELLEDCEQDSEFDGHSNREQTNITKNWV